MNLLGNSNKLLAKGNSLNIMFSSCFNMIFTWMKNTYARVKTSFRKLFHPGRTIPEAIPLSPCIIEPYEKNDNGVEEENKAYIPVSLLKKAIENDRILNIAVAGNYGVGKSSIINTAEKDLKCRHKFIKISLASLLVQENIKANKQDVNNSPEVDSPQDPAALLEKPKIESIEGSVTYAQIEYSILQQILYHDKPHKTPKSRIKRIHKTRAWKPCIIAILCLSVFLAFVFFSRPSWAHISRYLNLSQVTGFSALLVKWGPLVVFAGGFVVFCCYLAKHYSFSISSLGYKDVELKIKDKMSIFNAYLDEIVYFFESTRYDVVVFEDLDRFSNKEVIFYKLRELNTILNNCGSLKREVTFVYSVLDDLFDSKERVKFFDYIISVIPVINSSNSYNKLKAYVKSSELFDKLGRNELLNLCDYFQDMRLLLNIVNEFNQFIPLIDTEVMTEKVLFGLVVYKNYLPSDFSLMYNKAGVVAGILEETENRKEALILGINKSIEDTRERLNGVEREREKKLVALREKYLETSKTLSNYKNYDLQISIGNERYLFEAVAKNDALFASFRNNQASFLNGNTPLLMPVFANVEKNLGGVGYFDNTVTNINNEFARIKDELEWKLLSFEQELTNLPSTVEGIYKKDMQFLDEKLSAISDPEKRGLVKFLILNGYLDKDYQYYISYFYPNSLKREDRNFVMRAGRMEGLQYEVKLKAVDEILMRFDAQDFETNISLLNIDILREVYKDKKHNAYRPSICSLIAQTNNLDFIKLAYVADSAISSSFFFQLLKVYDFWNEIETVHGEESELLREIYLKFCDLREEHRNPAVVSWLNNNYSFIESRWDKITSKRAIDIFKALGPCFGYISYKDTPDDVFQDILEHRRYEFNRKNVIAIVKRLGFYNEYKTASYTSIKKNGNPALIQSVQSNWSAALKSVFPKTSIYETDASKCDIICTSLAMGFGYEARFYLKNQHDRIQDIKLLPDNCLDFAVEYSLIAPMWSNIYYYAVTKGKGLPMTYINGNNFHEKISKSATIEEENVLRRLIVFSDRLKLSKYKEIIPLFSLPFETIEENIQPIRMRYIIENNFLRFNEENYTAIREKYNLSSLFITNNIDEFVKAPQKYKFGKEEVIAVLDALPSKKAKCDFLRSIRDIDICPDDKLTSLVKPLIEGNDIRVQEINKYLLLSVISNSTEPLRTTLGRRAIISVEYSPDLISDILKSMGGEYKRLLSSSSISTLTYSRDAIVICNYLTTQCYLKKCERKGDKILINKK